MVINELRNIPGFLAILWQEEQNWDSAYDWNFFSEYLSWVRRQRYLLLGILQMFSKTGGFFITLIAGNLRIMQIVELLLMGVVVKVVRKVLLGHSFVLLVKIANRVFTRRLIVIKLIQRTLVHASEACQVLLILHFRLRLLPIVNMGRWLVHVPWLPLFGLLPLVSGKFRADWRWPVTRRHPNHSFCYRLIESLIRLLTGSALIEKIIESAIVLFSLVFLKIIDALRVLNPLIV